MYFTEKYYQYFDHDKLKELREQYEMKIRQAARRKDYHSEKKWSRKLWMLYEELKYRNIA